ncbi:hypothetical protein [Embleya sp. NPDC001921]
MRISDRCAQPLTLTAAAQSLQAVTVKAFDPANAYQKRKISKSNGTLKLTNPQTGPVLDTPSVTQNAIVTVKWVNYGNSQSRVPFG